MILNTSLTVSRLLEILRYDGLSYNELGPMLSPALPGIPECRYGFLALSTLLTQQVDIARSDVGRRVPRLLTKPAHRVYYIQSARHLVD